MNVYAEGGASLPVQYIEVGKIASIGSGGNRRYLFLGGDGEHIEIGAKVNGVMEYPEISQDETEAEAREWQTALREIYGG